MTNQRNFIVLVFVILGVAFVISGFSESTGAQIFNAKTNSISTTHQCNYIYSISAADKTGNKFCKSQGYNYAAFVDRYYSRILFDSYDGQCFTNGHIQVDEILFYQKLKGSDDLTGLEYNNCINMVNTGVVEPEYGDQFVTSSFDGALCCK